MRVTILGTGAACPRAGGACSGFLVRGENATVWLDAGNGTLSRLLEHVSCFDLDALVISHSHADHISDVLPFMYGLGFADEPVQDFPVYAPPDVPPIVSAPLGSGSIDIFRRVFDFSTTGPVFEVGDLRFEPFRTVHPVETYGYRISEGDRTFVYTSDTAPFPELADCCRDADLLLCEATFVHPMPSPPDIHMWAEEAGQMAQKAGAPRLLLTHVWPTIPLEAAVQEAASAYTGSVEAAAEGTTYTV
ncbi:MAG TPA: MBL fold metallo-hydrolase [Actinomycetota bacterium]|nr:MBL fold metallo-hydrolase [Actinomycetota bacterium]